MSNNRSLTLEGANTVFGVCGAVITRHELGYYVVTCGTFSHEAKTLTKLCQDFVVHLLARGSK